MIGLLHCVCLPSILLPCDQPYSRTNRRIFVLPKRAGFRTVGLRRGRRLPKNPADNRCANRRARPVTGQRACNFGEPPQTNCAERPFRNCLENNRRFLNRGSLPPRSDRSGLLRPLLEVLRAPIRDPIRFSKRFLRALGLKKCDPASLL